VSLFLPLRTVDLAEPDRAPGRKSNPGRSPLWIDRCEVIMEQAGRRSLSC
jgi:hypothetical protein